MQLVEGYDKHKQFWTGCVRDEIASTEGESSPGKDTEVKIDQTKHEVSPGLARNLAASNEDYLDVDLVEDEEERLALE